MRRSFSFLIGMLLITTAIAGWLFQPWVSSLFGE
jgi:hypothetical protein